MNDTMTKRLFFSVFPICLFLCGFLLVGCDNSKQSAEFALRLNLVEVGPNAITCQIVPSDPQVVNFVGLRYAPLDNDENSVEVYVEPDAEGNYKVQIASLKKQTTYRLTAFADIVSDSGLINSNPLEVRTCDPVEIQKVSTTDHSITCKLLINSPMPALIKGFTWKKKSEKVDPQTVYIEDSAKESVYTLVDLEKNVTYVLQAFAQLEGADQFAKSEALDVFTGDIVLDGDYQLVFADEFDGTGYPNTAVWHFEEGEKIRNNEAQFYSKSEENAFLQDGYLHIVAYKQHKGSDGKMHNYTSASMTTSKSFVWCYGRMEVRAKIPTGSGMWPAIWMVGNDYNWPSNGELDVMEYYREGILANAAWGSTKQWEAIWDSSKTPMSHFESKNPNWRNEFHLWVTEWDEDYIRIFLDEELLNEIDLSQTFNRGGYQGNTENPFRYHKAGWGDYIWLNLALGGNNGGSIDDSLFPAEYLVDYVRVYQKTRLPEDK